MTNGSKVWLITSASRGVGRALTEAVLESGERVIATARDPRPLDDLAERYVRRFASLALDPSDERDVARTVLQAREHFGRLDVVVSDASGEGADGDDIDETMGARALAAAVLPLLKLQRSGHLFELSSAERRDLVPEASLRELGVRVTRVERYRDDTADGEPQLVRDTDCPFRDRVASLFGVDRQAREARATTRAIMKAADAAEPARRIVVRGDGQHVGLVDGSGAWVGVAGVAAAAMLFFKG